MRLRVLICTALLMLQSACDIGSSKYEVARAGNQTFLLNKQSGDLRLLEGTTWTPVVARETLALIAKPKSVAWPAHTIPQLEGLTVTVRTTYRDGQLLYLVRATPFKGPIEKQFLATYTTATLNIDLDDADGFGVSTVRVGVRGPGSPTRIVDEKGEPFMLQWRGSVEMSPETYAAIASTSVGWSGFDKE